MRESYFVYVFEPMPPVLNSVNEAALAIIALFVFLASKEIGFRLGAGASTEADGYARQHVDNLQTALLGLVALLLGFSFAMAVARYDARKALVLEEANAIGTAYQRTQLVPQPHRDQLASLMRTYIDNRIAFYAVGIDSTSLAATDSESARLEKELWANAVAISTGDTRSIPAGLLIQSLNDMFDLNEKRRGATRNHVPETVLSLVFFIGVLSFGFVGYSCGLHQRRRVISTALMAVAVSLVLALVLDLDRPRRGLIKVGQDSMLRLKQQIEDLPQK